MVRVKKDRGRRRRERREAKWWDDPTNRDLANRALSTGEVTRTWGLAIHTYEAPNHGWGIPLRDRWKTIEAKG